MTKATGRMSQDGPINDDEFRTTRWTLVRRAGGAAGLTLRGEALGELLHRYLPALRSHLVARMRIDKDRAEDLLQGFIVRKILEYDLLSRADQERGKFRTLLLTSLDNFVRNELDRRVVDGKHALTEDLPDGSAPADADFDVPWARALVSQAIERMRKECADGGREDLWGVFDARVLGPALRDEHALEYLQLVRRFNYTSPAQASNALVTSKRMFERILRSLVCEYAADDAEIDSEIADLREVLSRASDRDAGKDPNER